AKVLLQQTPQEHSRTEAIVGRYGLGAGELSAAVSVSGVAAGSTASVGAVGIVPVAPEGEVVVVVFVSLCV
ncbi:MAG TPA: hypothetical protein VK993_13675, partial [Chthoniobacterales bacterium]|nr:hypothetical protein [Chthoniobacterales bacterium]